MQGYADEWMEIASCCDGKSQEESINWLRVMQGQCQQATDKSHAQRLIEAMYD